VPEAWQATPETSVRNTYMTKAHSPLETSSITTNQ